VSIGIDDYCDVYENRVQTARKDHKCSACRETIRKGDKYNYHFQVFEREAATVKRCARCQLIFQHLEGLLSGGCDEGVDQKLNCGHSYSEVHGVEPPPEIAALAFALPGEVQGLLAPKEGGADG